MEGAAIQVDGKTTDVLVIVEWAQPRIYPPAFPLGLEPLQFIQVKQDRRYTCLDVDNTLCYTIVRR